MGRRGLEYFFRIAAILAFLCLITIFFTERGSAEFYITAVSLGVSLAVSVVSGILIRKSKK